MRRSVLVLLVIVGMLLAGCGPAMVPAAAPQTESGEVFVIALPRIVIAFDANGKPGLEGLALEDILSTLGMPMDLSSMAIPAAYPAWMTQANIQHIELRQTGAGLAILVNGMPMPHVGFTDASIAQMSDLAPLLMMQGEVIKKFAPIVSRLGVSIAVKFPLQAGEAEIPFASDEVATAAAAPSGDPASAVVKFEIKYSANGVPAILGISAQDLASMGIAAPLALAPDYIALLQANNIQNLELRSKADGLWVYVNGIPLPNIVWDKKMVANAVEVGQQLYGSSLPEAYWMLIQDFAPMLGSADVDVLVHFPLAAGVAAIPAMMH